MNVSVAMCTYNGAKYLPEQLRGIADQTALPHELIICDDRSTDATQEVVQDFAERAPFPVRFIRNERNLGSTKNFEKAIRLCRGDAIALCDQDDLWGERKLERLGEVLVRDSEAGGVFSDAALVDEHSRPLTESLWGRRQFTPKMQRALNQKGAAQILLEKNVVTGATFMFRSQFVDQVTPIPPEWVHDGWIAMLVASLSRLVALPDRLMSYRLHPEQQIGVQAARWQDALEVDKSKAVAAHERFTQRWSLMEKQLTVLPGDPSITRLLQRRVAFLQARTTLREQKLAGRLISATVLLPGYCKFSRGLLSYGRDITNAGYRKPQALLT